MVTVGGLYLHRKLQQMLPGVLRKRLRQLTANIQIPTVSDLEAGARELVRDRITEVGEARILADEAYDIPLVDISAEEDRYRVVMISSAFHYTMQQERAASKGQLNLSDIKMSAAQRVIEEKTNIFAFYGVPNIGITGLVNDPNVALTNSSFNPYDVNTTGDQLVDFVLEEIEEIATRTNNVDFPTDMLVSIPLFFKLVRTRMSNTQVTALNYIYEALQQRNATPGIQRIVPLPEMRSEWLEKHGVQAAGTNKDRIVLYPKDPEILERHNELTQLAPAEYTQVKDLKRIFPMFACEAQIAINYPQAISYIDISKKS